MANGIISIFLIEDGENSVLQLWWSKKKNEDQGPWVEVRGDINDWDPNTWFHQVHDIKRMNCSQLHAGEICHLLPEWDGWEIAAEVLNMAA